MQPSCADVGQPLAAEAGRRARANSARDAGALEVGDEVLNGGVGVLVLAHSQEKMSSAGAAGQHVGARDAEAA